MMMMAAMAHPTASALHMSWRSAVPPLADGSAVGDVEPVDHHQAEAVGRDGQQDRVGVGGPPAQDQVEGERDPEEAAAEDKLQAAGHLAVGADPDIDVGEEHDGGRRDDEQQLDVAAAAWGEAGDDGHRVTSTGSGPWSGSSWGWPRATGRGCRVAG